MAGGIPEVATSPSSMVLLGWHWADQQWELWCPSSCRRQALLLCPVEQSASFDGVTGQSACRLRHQNADQWRSKSTRPDTSWYARLLPAETRRPPSSATLSQPAMLLNLAR